MTTGDSRALAVRDPDQQLQAIAVQPPNAALPTKDEMAMMTMLSRSVIQARGLIPAQLDTPEKAFAVLLAGWELGVKPMTALRHLFIVGGKVEPDAQIMAGILASKEPESRIEVVALTDDSCTMRIERPARGVRAEYTYTLADAKKAQLVKPGSNWDKFPKDMMRWAATKRLCRAYAPDIINAIADAGAGAMLAAAVEGRSSRELAEYVDAHALASPELYSPGDRPGIVVAEDGTVVDSTTGEVLEGTAANEQAPAEVLNEEPAPTEEPSPVVDELPSLVGDGTAEPETEAQAEGTDPRLGRWPHLGAFVNEVYEEYGLNTGRILEALGYARNSAIAKVLDYEDGLNDAYVRISQLHGAVGSGGGQ